MDGAAVDVRLRLWLLPPHPGFRRPNFLVLHLPILTGGSRFHPVPQKDLAVAAANLKAVDVTPSHPCPLGLLARRGGSVAGWAQSQAFPEM